MGRNPTSIEHIILIIMRLTKAIRLYLSASLACVHVSPFVVQRLYAHPPRVWTKPDVHEAPKNGISFHHKVRCSMSENVSDYALTEDESKFIFDLHERVSRGTSTLDDLLLEALPNMNPKLILKLRQGFNHDSRKEVKVISEALNSIIDSRLTSARDLLAELLDAGEIRKLDALIGEAARAGNLDVAFFQVMNMNLQDAAESQAVNGGEEDGSNATRYQILKHIYTRCQEEVEKTIPPGVALLNKLLRTEAVSIRTNQLKHYLCPQPNIITTPDGKELELKGREKILVSHEEFIAALGNAVKQIRTVENAGGADRAMAASMVESCRTVAKEARLVIAEYFGRDSDELKMFEDGLMPVFRPSSPESPYIRGL